MSHQHEKQELLIILLIVFIGFVGTSIAYPIFPPLFLVPSTDSIIPFTWQEKDRSIFLGLALAVYPLGQFIGSPLLGGYSDQYGRKKILMISLYGCVIGYFFSTLALYIHSLWILLLSRFITGVMEGNFAIVRAMASEFASINKYKSIGKISAVASIGYVLGPLLGGILSDNTILPLFSYSFPFFIAMIFAMIAALFAHGCLHKDKQKTDFQKLMIWQSFNVIRRFKKLFTNNKILKQLIIISTIFTFAVDIFYEFGPVYLTGLWQMTPSQIAIYNAALSLTLAIGASSLAHYLSLRFLAIYTISISISITSFILLLMATLLSPLFVFFLFALIGFSIAAVNTNMTVAISNIADKNIQGEALGAQLSFRTLGDAIICFAGGFLIISSVILPILVASIVAFISLAIYVICFFKFENNRSTKNINEENT